jgi:predicted metal-dependent HD superfamily phosphohydrolase
MTGGAGPLTLEAVRAAYSEPHRRYHDVRHVRAVLACLHRWSHGAPVGDALLAAALYHDVVYDPRAADNEERSAGVCADRMRSSGYPGPVVSRAVALIRSTRTHDPIDDGWDAVALLDADLMILGAPARAYRRYAAAIRAEYVHVSDRAYHEGRTRVLGGFLRRPRLFLGDWTGVEERELRACGNVRREIESLRRGA